MPKINIFEMLKYRRPARSKTEEAFIERYIDTLPGVYFDSYGNRLVLKDGARVLISCHTDTVHRSDGMQKIRQSPGGTISLHKKENESNCLGADDTAGIYAAIRMIEAGVNASFIFHRDEEIGGRGSSWLAKTYPDWLAGFDICLALDRRGMRDIITSQATGNCASHAFAEALGHALGMGHEPRPGVFTDSANYNHLIPECSNISIGYDMEHTRLESLETHYLEALIDRLIKVDWESIPVVRDPADLYVYDDDDDDYVWSFGAWNSSARLLEFEDWDEDCICFEREGDNLNCVMHSVGRKSMSAS